MEFDTAKNVTSGLESAFGALLTEFHLETVIDKLTAGKTVFGIENITIAEGSKANFTFFTPEGKSTFTKENILSKSKNSAFLGTEIKGSVYGILNQNKLVISK
jgi:dihydroorotase